MPSPLSLIAFEEDIPAAFNHPAIRTSKMRKYQY